MLTDGLHLPDLLKALRAERGWTQKELGREAGINNTAISRFEAGERIPTPDQAEDLGAAFRLSGRELDDFLDAARTYREEGVGRPPAKKPSKEQRNGDERASRSGALREPRSARELATSYLRNLERMAAQRGVPAFLTHLQLAELWSSIRVAQPRSSRGPNDGDVPQADMARYWLEELQHDELASGGPHDKALAGC